jgi:hypothetical protein
MTILSIFKIVFFVFELIISALLIEQLYQYFMERVTFSFIKKYIDHETFIKKSRAIFTVMAVLFFAIQLFFYFLIN